MNLSKNLGIVAAFVSLALAYSCTEDVSVSQLYSVEGAVEISAQVGSSSATTRTNPQSTDSLSQTIFNEDDVIGITNDEWTTTYQYELNENSVWVPTESGADYVIKWGSESTTFQAYYPVGEGISYTNFTLPTDQSEEDKIVAADYMLAEAEYESKPSDCKAEISFDRQTARVIINIESINGEPGDYDGYVSDLKVNSPYASVSDGECSGEVVTVSPYLSEDYSGKAGTKYMALLLPTEGMDDATFITLTLCYNSQEKELSLTGIPELKKGYSYTFNITIEDPISIKVDVEEWTDAVISSYKAAIKYVEYNFNVSDNLTEYFGDLLEQEIGTRQGVTLALYGDMTAEQFDTLRMFLANTGSEADLILDLTNMNSSPMATLETAFDASISNNRYWWWEEAMNVPGLVSVIFPSPSSDDESSGSKQLTRSSSSGGYVIGDYAFERCRNLSELINSEYATSIGVEGFASCQSLVTANFANVTFIDTIAFSNDSALVSINIPKVEKIERWAFNSCTSLKSMDLPVLTDLGALAFCYCYSMESVSIPQVEEIKEYTFYDCESLTSIVADNATIADTLSFCYCLNLEEINLPALKSLGVEAMGYCYSLSGVELPLLETADTYAFYCCTGLEEISLPELKTLGYGGFAYCTSLETATFPKLESLPKYAFYRCASLETASLGEVELIDSMAFYPGCTGLTTVTAPLVETVNYAAFYGCTSLKEANFPEAETVGRYVFYKCTSLEEAYLPNATELGDFCFANCTSLKKVTLGDIQALPTLPFNNCSSLVELDMSNCTSVPTLTGTTTFSSPFNGTSKSASDITVYVANEEMKEAFESATYWTSCTIKVKGESDDEE